MAQNDIPIDNYLVAATDYIHLPRDLIFNSAPSAKGEQLAYVPLISIESFH